MSNFNAMCSGRSARIGMPERTRADVVYQAATLAAALLLLITAAVS